MSLLIGLDIGTTNVKALAFDPQTGQATEPLSLPTPVAHPVPGYSEHPPEILWQAVSQCLNGLAQALPDRRIAGLSVSSFGEAGLPLDVSGDPLYPIIAWYDRRCESQTGWWEKNIPADRLHAITGQCVSIALGRNKWMWLRDNRPELVERTAHWLSAPDYIRWRLTGVMATDPSIASRTGLFDHNSRSWSKPILDAAGLDADLLPQVLPSWSQAGSVSSSAARTCGLPAGTPVVLGGHDHLCAALAAGAVGPGDVVDSSGTAEALLFVLPGFLSTPEIVNRGFPCYPHVVPDRFVLKGGLKAAGGAVEWLLRQLAGFANPQAELPYALIESIARQGLAQRAGPLWLPHLLGSGTPQADRHSLGAAVGLKLEHDQGDLFRGLLESLAFWLRHNLEEMQSLTGQAVKDITLLGGTHRLQLLSQLKADVTNRLVYLPQIPETAALGAALLAGIGVQIYSDVAEAVNSLQYSTIALSPDKGRAAWYGDMYHDAYLPLHGALRDVNQTLTEMQHNK